MMKNLSSVHGTAVYADATAFRPALDLHKGIKNRTIETAGKRLIIADENMGSAQMNTLDFASWLPFAAQKLNISSKVQDYVLVPCIAMPTGLPNRNGVAFPLQELKSWSTDDGMLAYQTFKGKPCHIEHDNEDPTKAIGVIVDTALVPMTGFGGGRIWKLLLLNAIDRTKDPVRANYILSGEMNSYSMGAWVETYTCGYCNAALGSCKHIDLKRPRDFYSINGRLAFRNVKGVRGFENSSVAEPAYLSSISDRVMPMGV
jgi:hypothetical protein